MVKPKLFQKMVVFLNTEIMCMINNQLMINWLMIEIKSKK